MEELVNKLNAIPNSYFGFVAGVSFHEHYLTNKQIGNTLRV